MDVAGIVRQAAAIEGWMSEQELEWLALQASSRRAIVEVGSWLGRSTKAIAATTLGTVYAVDSWEGPADGRHGTGLQEKFRQNLSGEIASGKCTPICADSRRAPDMLRSLLPDGMADMIFIDADHTYAVVRDDITTYRTLARPGALLCGHDYHDESQDPWAQTVHRGVRKAVDELVPGRLVVGTIWFWTVPS